MAKKSAQEEMKPLEHELRVVEKCCAVINPLTATQAERVIAFLHHKFVETKDFS